MDARGWVANHDGNVTVKIGADLFAATPSGRAKFDLKDEDLIELDSSGSKVSGNGKPFSEFAVHAKVYALRPEVGAVLHSHAPFTTAVGCVNQEMVTTGIPEAVISLGPGVPLVGLALPNSPEFFSEFATLIPHYDAVMIAGNGIFTWGKDLEQAYLRMELVEHLAQIFAIAQPLGTSHLLAASQRQTLLKKRAEAGLALPPDPARPHWFE